MDIEVRNEMFRAAGAPPETEEDPVALQRKQEARNSVYSEMRVMAGAPPLDELTPAQTAALRKAEQREYNRKLSICLTREARRLEGKPQDEATKALDADARREMWGAAGVDPASIDDEQESAAIQFSQETERDPLAEFMATGTTPRAKATMDLQSAKNEVRDLGGDEADILRRIAERIRQKVRAMTPEGKRVFVSDADVEKMADVAVESILDHQRERVGRTVEKALRMQR